MTARVLLTLLLVPLAGCISSTVVEQADRAVTAQQAELAWRPATAEDLPGFWSAIDVSGESAGALLKAYYVFTPEGAYSGAALVVGEVGPRFVVIAEDGRWALDGSDVDLHDGSGPARALVAPGHLRLIGAETTITFETVALD